MRYSPIIRFRIDRQIANRAEQMAQARGLELPDVMRMMVNWAVRTGSFGIDETEDDHPSETRGDLNPFEPRYWEPFKAAIDAELAIALLQYAIANPNSGPCKDKQTRKGDGSSRETSNKRHDRAPQLLADFHVFNRAAVDDVINQWGGNVGLNNQGPRESARLTEQRLIGDVMAGTERSDRPAAIVVLGQPGASVPYAAALLAREMARTAGPAVRLSAERMRAYDPEHDEARARRTLGRAVASACKGRRNVVIEDEMADPPWTARCMERLRKEGYAVQAVVVCVSSAVSHLAITARYALWRQHQLPAQFVAAERHDVALAHLRSTLTRLEEQRSVDGLRVITRGGRQLFENRMAGQDWLRPPKGTALFDKEQNRAVPDKELVQMAMRWETLTRVLVHDRAVPRDVASQVLTWRSDAVERCESSTQAAQILQWAYEGAAFREMDRFTFEEAFPHNARATALMGDAIIEAEKYDAAESARFSRSARENIAQRIEHGDMARIAARNEAMKSRK